MPRNKARWFFAIVCLFAAFSTAAVEPSIQPVGLSNHGAISSAWLQSPDSIARPRIYLDETVERRLRQRTTDPSWSWVWLPLMDMADQLARRWEKTRNRETDKLRGFVDRIVGLLIAYKASQDVRFRELVFEILDTLSEQEDWFGNTDRRAAIAVYSMAMAYDWLYSEMSPERRAVYLESLVFHATLLHQAMVNHEEAWSENYLGNHNHTNSMAIGIAGMVLYGEVDEASQWLSDAQENFQTVLDFLPSDGASPEGVGYWSESMSALLSYALAVEPVYGLDALRKSRYFQNAARYRMHMGLPGFAENVNYADSPMWDYQGPQHVLYALADIFSDPLAAWLADEITRNRDLSQGAVWLSLIWNGAEDIGSPNDGEATGALFENLGIFVGRTSWEKSAIWFFFKAGPPWGWDAYHRNYIRGGHIHPDQGQFLYYRNGEWVAVDDGYVTPKRTENHNVLMFDDMEQLGGGGRWYKKGRSGAEPPRLRQIDSQTGDVLLKADLRGAYLNYDTLEKAERDVVFLGDGTLIVRDFVESREAADMTSTVHLLVDLRLVEEDLYCYGKDGAGRLKLLMPKSGELAVYSHEIPQSDRRAHTREASEVFKVKSTNTKRFENFFVFYEGVKNCGRGNEEVVKVGKDSLSLKLNGYSKQVTFSGDGITITNHSED